MKKTKTKINKTKMWFFEKINIPVTSTEIETVIKNLPTTTKIIGLHDFTAEFYQTCRKELTPILKLFLKCAEGGPFQNPYYEATMTLTPKPTRYHKKEDYRQILLMKIYAKILPKY